MAWNYCCYIRVDILNKHGRRTKLSIGNQKAGQDLYNTAGNLIINPVTNEPIYFPIIQSVLRKGETIDGDFFKKEPEWVDYEQDFIVNRQEVDEIIKKLDHNKIQLVLGAPASGKSIILKNVGYKLTDKNHNIYVVELKKHPQDDIKLFFDYISKKEDENSIFIVDDAHLYLSDCERLIRNFKGRGKGKLIIGSREPKEITEGDPTKSSEFEYLGKTAIHIQAKDIAEEIIKMFLKRQHHFDEDRIGTASENLEKYKKDLWYLSWALKAFNSDDYSVDENKIYKNIKKRIENINAENVFLLLSVFFRYEIPIERKFLEKQMGLEGKSIINHIIGLQEIVETEELRKPAMLSLHHSSLAELYFATYQNYPSLGEEIREKILDEKYGDDIEYCSFHRYLTTTDPRKAIDILVSLERFSEHGKLTLLGKLISDGKIQIIIEKGIEKEKEKNIEEFGWRVRDISILSHELGLKLVINNIEMLDTYIIARCGYHIARPSEKAGMKLVDSIITKIQKEPDIDKIRDCIENIFSGNHNAGYKLINNIDIKALSSKIEKEYDLEKIGYCIQLIIGFRTENVMKLLDYLNIEDLSSKIENEKDIDVIGEFLSTISSVSKEIALKLVNNINIDSISSKIENEKNISTIRWFLYIIASQNEEIALKLVNNIKIDNSSSKIEHEKNISNIGEFLEIIASNRNCIKREYFECF